MKRVQGIFRLTSGEQRVVVMIILALLTIAIAQKHRERNASQPIKHSSESTTPPKPADAD